MSKVNWARVSKNPRGIEQAAMSRRDRRMALGHVKGGPVRRLSPAELEAFAKARGLTVSRPQAR